MLLEYYLKIVFISKKMFWARKSNMLYLDGAQDGHCNKIPEGKKTKLPRL